MVADGCVLSKHTMLDGEFPRFERKDVIRGNRGALVLVVPSSTPAASPRARPLAIRFIKFVATRVSIPSLALGTRIVCRSNPQKVECLFLIASNRH